jgi:hypothetical protein
MIAEIEQRQHVRRAAPDLSVWLASADFGAIYGSWLAPPGEIW